VGTGGGGQTEGMTTPEDPKTDERDDRDPDPADEAAAASDDHGAGKDGSVPGAATAGAGGARQAREGEGDDEGG